MRTEPRRLASAGSRGKAPVREKNSTCRSKENLLDLHFRVDVRVRQRVCPKLGRRSRWLQQTSVAPATTLREGGNMKRALFLLGMVASVGMLAAQAQAADIVMGCHLFLANAAGLVEVLSKDGSV